MTNTSASAPAARKARAESYSQLLPGNTGMITRGRANLAPPYTCGASAWKETGSTAGASPFLRYGNTPSSPEPRSQASCSSARSTTSPASANS